MSSDCPPRSRPFVVNLLASLKGITRRELARRTGRSKAGVDHYLSSSIMPEDVFDEFTKAIGASAAEVALTTGFHEALLSLDRPSTFPGERDTVEVNVLSFSRWIREVLAELPPIALAEPRLEKYPLAWEVESARWRA